ncbi:TMTC2 protein, partial [Polyodon spathula]|nr:TMTC2 protein [Polyodon spathula]
FSFLFVSLQKKNTSLLLSVSSLATWGASLLVARLYWMGNKPPSFSNSDNPAADSHSLLTKTLTFFYLPSVNMWLLLCPDTLSFDWSMDAVPLLRNVSDWRNLHTVAFYVGLLLLSWVGLRSPSRVKETNGKAYVVNGIHTGMNGKHTGMNGKHTGTNGKHTGTNGHSCHTNMGLPNSESHPVKSTENGIKNHVIPRTSLPTTENIVVFSLGLLMVPFLPATNLFFYVGFVIAERVLYIPSMGFCLLVTVGMRALYIKFRRRFLKSLLLYCTATLVLLYGIKTVLRNQDWQDEEMLYKSGINVNPAKAWGNLGNVLKSQGKMAEAEQAYRNALYYRSNMADMLYNLGLLLQENNKFSEALHYYKLAIGSRPTLASAYLNTGIILMNLGRLDEAKRTFLTCAEIPDENLKDPHAHQSSVTSCLYNLGKLFYERGQIEEALSAYKKAIRKMPRQFAGQSLYNMMGEAYMRLNKLAEAEHCYLESLRAKPDHIPAHLTYGKLLALTKLFKRCPSRKLHFKDHLLNIIPNYAGFMEKEMHISPNTVVLKDRHKLLNDVQSLKSQLSLITKNKLCVKTFHDIFKKLTNYYNPGHKREAEQYFLKAIQLDPTKGNCYMHYGKCQTDTFLVVVVLKFNNYDTAG